MVSTSLPVEIDTILTLTIRAGQDVVVDDVETDAVLCFDYDGVLAACVVGDHVTWSPGSAVRSDIDAAIWEAANRSYISDQVSVSQQVNASLGLRPEPPLLQSDFI